MLNLNASYRARIGLPDEGPLRFDRLGAALERAAYAIPFENHAVIESRTRPITQANLLDKITVRGEGGLCYELNTLFCSFLLASGWNARLVTGVVYNHEAQRYAANGRTHVAIMVRHSDRTYLVDTGFGSNLPLCPVPLSGEPVVSSNGEFRVVRASGEHALLGNYRMEMKLHHKHTEWMTGYTFDTSKEIADPAELDAIQDIIVRHPESPFNKTPLATKLTPRGSITLTPATLTEWEDGVMTKTPVEDAVYRRLLKQRFGLGDSQSSGFQ